VEDGKMEKPAGRKVIFFGGFFLGILILAFTAQNIRAEEIGRACCLKLGLGYGYWIKGLLNWPVEWRGSSPVVVLSFQKSTERFSHNTKLAFGRSGSISVNGRRRPGENGFYWLPAEYSFTWHCARNVFRIKRLDWGFGGTAQFMRLRETVYLQEGESARHWEQYVGLGPNMAFRWQSANSSWTAKMMISFTCFLPYLSRAGVISDVIPEHSGGLWWLRSGVSISVDRALSKSWVMALVYDRDAVIGARTASYKLKASEFIGGGNYLLSHFSMKIGYRW